MEREKQELEKFEAPASPGSYRRAPTSPSGEEYGLLPTPPASSHTQEEFQQRLESVWGDALASGSNGDGSIRANTHGFLRRFPLSIRRRIFSHTPVGPDAEADFEVADIIAQGGMAVILSGRQCSLDRDVAIKMLKSNASTDDDSRRRFLNEALVIGDLDHPNIVPIYDLALNEQDQLFYAMKRVEGTPWSRVIGDLDERENLRILEAVADGIAYAHSRGIVHRDIKPANVMLGEFGEVLIIDWGIAIPFVQVEKHDPALNAVFGGTPAYMAPELATGDLMSISPLTDVYLLGALLYEIVTGHPPHCGASLRQTLLFAATNVIQAVDHRSDLLEIAYKAMSTEPARRFGSVKAFQEEVRAYQVHADSRTFSDRAIKLTEEAIAANSYSRFSQALFAFEEALRLWPENRDALREVDEARRAYAECAARNEDFDLAASLLEQAGMQESELAADVARGRTARDLGRSPDRTDSALAALRWAERLRDAGRLDAAESLADELFHYCASDAERLRVSAFLFDLQSVQDQANELPGLCERLRQEWPDATVRVVPGGLKVECADIGLHSLDALSGLPIVELDCSGNLLESLQPLEGAPLRRLDCSNNNLTSLSGLEGAPLRLLLCGGNRIEDLAPVSASQLTGLWCADNQLRSLEPLRGFRLSALDCARNQIESLRGLQNVPLRFADVSDNPAGHIEPLRGAPLAYLNCRRVGLDNLEPLRGAPLRVLLCDGNQVQSLEPLRGMKVQVLSCSGNRIANLLALEGHPLRLLFCFDNPLDELAPFDEEPQPAAFCFEPSGLPRERLGEFLDTTFDPANEPSSAHAAVLTALRDNRWDELAAQAARFEGNRYLFVPRACTWQEANQLAESCGAAVAHPGSVRLARFLCTLSGDSVVAWADDDGPAILGEPLEARGTPTRSGRWSHGMEPSSDRRDIWYPRRPRDIRLPVFLQWQG